MTSYLCVLGRTPALALVELRTFFPSIEIIDEQVVLIPSFPQEISPAKLMDRLGGTVKIAKVLGPIRTLTAEALARCLIEEKPGDRITFGLSCHGLGEKIPRSFLNQVKRILESQGVHARFIEPRDDTALASVVVAKQKVTELVIVKYGSVFLIGRTVAVQPFEAWNKRDWGRPYADPKVGMLPPKVARMAVNIALRGFAPQGKRFDSQDRVLLDPFCGMGTILAEALLTGWQVIGSDQSREAVEKAEQNLAWLLTRSDLVGKPGPTFPEPKLFVSDATHVSDHLLPNSVDAIVTEPFMGKAKAKFKMKNVKLPDIENTVKGLEKLYIGCLKDWNRLLTPAGKVVIALPRYVTGEKSYFVKKVVDNCETLGYTVSTGPIEYSRPQAVVRREFFVLQKI